MTPAAVRLSTLGYRLAGGLILLAFWELIAWRAQFLLVPRVGETLIALAHLLASAALWQALLTSNESLVVGFASALVIGVPLGLLSGRRPGIGRGIDAYVNVLLVLPTVVLPPLVFLFLAPGLAARALVVALFSLPVIVQYTTAAMREVEPRLHDVARVFNATPWQTWRLVLLPAATPGLIFGARLGLARAFEGMVVVELLMFAVGLGELLLTFQSRFDAGSMYAVTLVLLAEAALCTELGRAFERRVSRHRAGANR